MADAPEAWRIGGGDPLRMAWHQTSDLGNARRALELSGGKLLWIEDAECFAHYDGRRWTMQNGDVEAMRIAHLVIEHIGEEAQALGEIIDDSRALAQRVGGWCTAEIATDRIKVLQSHALRSGNSGPTLGMLRQLRALVTARLDEFDRDPLAYNVLNCTLRFVRGDGGWRVTERPHDPADRLMQLADVRYEPGAQCPFFLERLNMLTPDAEQRAAFQPLYGYSLTGLTSDQAFYVHQGKGGDGKSATHFALAELHGDYYRHAGVKTFLQATGQKNGSEHRSDLVRLAGDIRFVTCDEPPPRSVWEGETIKQVTGSRVTARGSHAKTEITYVPRFKLHAECNVIPRAPSDDKGFRRRFKLFQWRVSVDSTPAGVMPIDEVVARLRDEKPGILNWLITGALMWLDTRQIPQPSAMADVLSDFWADSSPLLEWLSEWCDTDDPQAMTPAKDLYDHFKNWCDEAGIENVMGKKAFGSALRDKQFASHKDSRGGRWRVGIRLRSEGMFGDAVPAPEQAAAPAPPVARNGPSAVPPMDDMRWGDDDAL